MSNDQVSARPGIRLGLNDSTFLLIATAILIFGAAVWCAHQPNVEKTDFSLTYVGARIVHQGQGHRLYDISLQKQSRDSIFQKPSPLLFEHPPFEALVFSPLANFSFRTAFLIWGIFNVTLWVLLMYSLRSYLPWPQEDLGYLVLWLIFAPLGVALYQGQSSIALLAVYAITYICLKHQHELLAGCALGFGLFKFQFVVPFVLIMVVRRQWRFLSGFMGTAAVLFLISLITVGWSGVGSYVRLLLAIGANPQNESFGSVVDMPTLYGLLYAILGTKIAHPIFNIVVAACSMLLVVLVGLRWPAEVSGKTFDLLFAAAIAASLVISSHMFTHDFSPLVLAMFLTAACVTKKTAYSLLLIIPLLLLWAFPLYFLFVAWHCLFLMCPVLLLFVWVALQLAKEMQERQGSGRTHRATLMGAQC